MQNFSIIHISTVTETEKRKLGVCGGGGGGGGVSEYDLTYF